MLYNALSIIVILCILVIGILVLSKKQKTRPDYYFIFFIFSVLVWLISNYLLIAITNAHYVVPILKSTFFTGTLMVYSLLVLSLEFPKQLIKKSATISLLTAIPAVAVLILSLSKYLITGYNLEDGLVIAHYGIGFYFFVGVTLTYLIAVFIVLFIQNKANKGISKQQTRFLFIGIGLSALFILSTDLLVPLIFNTNLLANFSFLGIIFLVIFATYAIFKHHLFDIKVISSELISIVILLVFTIETFFTRTKTEFVLRIIALIFVAGFCYLLVRSVLNDLKKSAELKKLSEEMMAKNESLKKLLDMRSEFLNIASHQLRTPVSVIKGSLSMFKEGDIAKLPKEKQDEFISNVYEKSIKLEGIINDILSASEMDTEGRFNMEATDEVQIEEFLEKIVKGFQMQAQKKSLSVVFIKPAQLLPKCKINERYLEQAISNLIDNAIHYTEKGSVEISAKQDNDNMVITIKDTGVGVPKDDLPKLFAKFARAKNAVNMYTDGSGLGLFIVKKIVEGHKGGKVWIESVEGKGTTFFVSVPIDSSK